MDIVISTDSNYVQHAAALVASILASHAIAPKFHLILDDDVSAEEVAKLSGMIGDRGGILNLLEIKDSGLFDDFTIDGHFSRAAYYRLLIPSYFPEDVDKVLYLDSDMIVTHDLRGLWSLKLDDHCFAAVAECPGFAHREFLGLPENANYFNTGVLLMNLDRCRKLDFMERSLNYALSKKGELKYHDQDVLNSIFNDEVLIIHPKWNVTSQLVGRKEAERNKEENDAVENPMIVHFTTSSKPWQFWNNHRYRGLYWKALKLTPWKSYRAKPRGLKDILQKGERLAKKLILMILRKGR